MNTLKVELVVPDAISVEITDDTIALSLRDGRTIAVPLIWYPRLFHASKEERNCWRLIGKGNGIHWDNIDEDISVEGLLAGKPSAESQESFQKWLKERCMVKKSTPKL